MGPASTKSQVQKSEPDTLDDCVNFLLFLSTCPSICTRSSNSEVFGPTLFLLLNESYVTSLSVRLSVLFYDLSPLDRYSEFCEKIAAQDGHFPELQS